MSNPGVITLASLDYFPHRFEVEDNIGEAIHVHYDDIRLDLTICEFAQLAQNIKDAFTGLIDVEGFSYQDFDLVFLAQIAGFLPDLERISYENIMLEELLIDTFDQSGEPVIGPLKESRVYKALQGDTSENDAHRQTNCYHSISAVRKTNRERLEYNLEQIRENGYHANNQCIVLFNDQNIIRDGQHRAACLYYLYGNISVPIRRLHFKDNLHSFEPVANDEPIGFASLFFGTGEGYSEDHKVVFEQREIRFGKRFNLPKNIKAIRFDPVEGANSMVSDLAVSCEKGTLSFKGMNGLDVGNTYLFETDDPHFFLEFEGEPPLWVELTASIISSINKKIFSLIINNFIEKTGIAAELDHRNIRLAEMVAELDDKNIKLAETVAELNDKNTKLADTASALEQLNLSYDTIVNSNCWKMTKPIRKIMDKISGE